MSYDQQYIVDQISMETILSRKFDLKQKQLLEPVLNSNFDYAAKAISSMPSAILSQASLCIAGESMLVRFLLANHKSALKLCPAAAQPSWSRVHFNVFTSNGLPQLTRYVTCGDVIAASDIKDAHFSGHSCQDMFESCSEQAKKLVSQGKIQDFAELHIICNELSLIYSISNDAKDSESEDSPPTESTQHSGRYILKTHCRLCFQGLTIIEQTLEMKCWIEREKPGKKGLIACVDYLLQQFTELPNPPYGHYRFVLQSDGEMVESRRIPNGAGKTYFFFGGAKGVSMFPAKWES